MAAFRFRAAAALELRRTQEKDAHTALSRAEARFHELRTAHAQLSGTSVQAQTSELSRERAGTDGTSLEWHRTWIIHLRASADRLALQIDAQAKAVAEARRAWLEARKRRRALERMRERAWDRYREEEDRRERADLDELARLRFVMTTDWRNDP